MSTTEASTASWPSRKTVAVTSNCLVDHRLGGAGAGVDAGSDVEDGDAADRMLGGTGARGCSHDAEPTGHERARDTPHGIPDLALQDHDDARESS